ncbi:MAG: OOP family OmpA-OmpF porin [Bacteroidia bacterium]
MRHIILFLIFISSVCLAQDTLVIDARIAKSVGKSVKYKFKSQTTGANQKINLKTGLWEYRDANDNLIKTETFLASGKSSFLQGPQTFYNEVNEPVLIRIYQRNNLAAEQPLSPCVILLAKDTLELLAEGDSVYINYPKEIDYTWFDYTNVIKINTIEDPNAEYKLNLYKHYEDSVGNPNLLASSSFGPLHPLNAVANPSFEKHPTLERSKTSFYDEITSWIPASLSPDFFITPEAARGGTGFVGIRVFSEKKDIEYVQNRLNYRLKKKQKYCFTTYLKLGPSCNIATDAFGVHFSANPISFKKLESTDIQPQLSLNTSDSVYLTYKSRWMLLQCSYVANGSENWMSLGTFKPSSQVNQKSIFGSAKESYYYIDDVSLIPIDRDEECPCNFSGDSLPSATVDFPSNGQDISLEFGNMKVGDKLILENVYFDIDQYTLLPQSIETLGKLNEALQKYPSLKIEISGHTSTTGGYNHNVTLSKNRANAVLRYLVNKGIDASRLTKAGYGPDLPIAPNDTEENRQMNRRVEVKVLEK